MMFSGDEDCDDEVTSGPILEEPEVQPCDEYRRDGAGGVCVCGWGRLQHAGERARARKGR